MATNAGLTTELARALLKQQPVLCPNCQQAILTSRWKHQNSHTEFKCSYCGTIYRPCKRI